MTSSYTPPPNGHRGLCPTCGEDYVALALRVFNDNYPELRPRFVQMKEAAGNRHKNHAKHGSTIIIDGRELRFYPHGRSLGGRYLAFAFECDGIIFAMEDSGYPAENVWNVYVSASGLACLNHGLEGCLTIIYGVLKALGGQIEAERLGRIDIRGDFPGMDIGVFDFADREARYISRACYHARHDGHGLTLQYGKRSPSVVVYDKLAEVRMRGDAYRTALTIDRCWNGEQPSQAARIELRLGRMWLKDHGVNTIADYYQRRSDILRYLTEDWFRYTADKVDRRNQKRAVLLPEWEQVAAAFAAWAGEPRGVALAPLPPPPLDEDQFFSQAYGCLRRVAENRGRELVPYGDFVDLLNEEVIRAS